MSLPDTYLTYPNRRYGQDISRHDWQLVKDRAPHHLPEGKKLAIMIVVPCEFHPINPKKNPFNHPAGMMTPYPDLRHFTTRDYGNRVGAFRILKALREFGLKATFPVSSDLIRRASPLIEAILADGHELAAAGVNGDTLHHSGLSQSEERQQIETVVDAFDQIGLKPKTWMSPARQESFSTPDLLTEAGFENVLDWETDQRPIGMKTDHGTLTALPLHNELEDYRLLIERKQSEALWSQQILEAAAFLGDEYDRFGSQSLGFVLTPFVAGQPFRIAALEDMLEGLTKTKTNWVASASEIAGAFAS